ncbi:MAG: endonuclease V [Deltaproteobacteria bacterium]|nr:MAG: endonuclease V [Deltaproteobacteria bacterium]
MMHAWDVSRSDAIKIQRRIAAEVLIEGDTFYPKTVAGVDVSYAGKDGPAVCCITVFSFTGMVFLHAAYSVMEVRFPYVTGLLTFREGPSIVSAFEKLEFIPDVLIFDGQGIAHPRRVGIASHMGVYLGVRTIGCAKTHLFGDYKEPGPRRGDMSPLVHGGDIIGMVLRTRDNTRPVFISPGHMIDTTSSVNIALACSIKYRLPEPVRQAHIMSRRLVGEITSQYSF